ncbi:hypothetical protein U27_05885 [Candidatus Vecturithrix granuli]|uniref:Uncharacterized protein n=1 Tax=Vecturithrix granuli TaxID=1499967 RepID=A0A081C2V5_VECG1|nr:hypothetical protein U27_05885 [Candidatus Vecturithrix granuli]
MYCQQCGIYHHNDAAVCQICGADLSQMIPFQDIRIFADLTQLPLRALVASIRRSHPLLCVLFIPLISLFYLIKKLTGRPFLSLNLTSKTPKIHLSDLKQFSALHQKSFRMASSFLQHQGFTPLVDLEDVSFVQANLQHLEINRERNLYATLHINKTSGKIVYVTFSAFFADGGFMSVDNTDAFPIQYPEHFLITHLPSASIQKTYQAFVQQLERFPEQPVYLSLEQLLPLAYARRTLVIDLGIEQGIFHPKGDAQKPQQASPCYHHPFNAAVRTCSQCGKALCEACYREYQQQTYCQDCLPEGAIPVEAEPFLSEQISYAGFGVRSIATLLDTLIIAAYGIGIYLALSYGLQSLLPDANIQFIPFLITQFLLVAGITWYLIIPLKKYGRTLGQKLLGLHVIDRYGNRPELAAALIRFAYHLLAGLFIFPLLGYFFILFRKKKQGWHDQLSDTYVITRHPRRKALFSWMMLLLIFGLVGWQAYQYRWLLSWLPFIGAPSRYDVQPEIQLEPKWEQTFEQTTNAMVSYLNHDDRCFVSTTTRTQALDRRTGNVLWTNASLTALVFQADSEQPDFPLLALHYDQEDDSWYLVQIDPNAGTMLWQQMLEHAEPRVVFNAHTILVYSDTFVQAFTPDGRVLWERDFRDRFFIQYAVLHSDILLGRYTDTALTLTYLDRTTGEKIWEMKNSPYHPGYVLDKDLQFFYTDDDNTTLLNVPEQRTRWEQPLSIGYVAAHGITGTDGALNIYTTQQALRADTGETLFLYPPDTRFGALTNDFLLLSYVQGDQQGLLLLERKTGKVLTHLGNKIWMGLYYLMENETTIYLAANLKPEKSEQFRIQSVLLIIDKPTFTLTEIPVGRNLGSLQWKIFPEDHLIMISTFQHLGGYMLPGK